MWDWNVRLKQQSHKQRFDMWGGRARLHFQSNASLEEVSVISKGKWDNPVTILWFIIQKALNYQHICVKQQSCFQLQMLRSWTPECGASVWPEKGDSPISKRGANRANVGFTCELWKECICVYILSVHNDTRTDMFIDTDIYFWEMN